jgi:ferric-dicitrate binding protein FerR (iron transport regulator)
MKDIDDIFAGYLHGEPLGDEERAIVDEWKGRSPGHRAFAFEIRWLRAGRGRLKGRAGEERAFQDADAAVRRWRRQRRWLRASPAAAGLLLLAGWFFLFPPVEREEERVEPLAEVIRPGKTAAELVLPGGTTRWLTPGTVISTDSLREIKTTDRALVYAVAGGTREQEFHTLNVPPGGEYDLQLSDGTMVSLNAGSTLRYPDFFTGQREVFLTGEAYFEVARDADHPFIVRSGDLSARVLGTSFNINAYPDREVIMTTLVEGRVRVDAGGQSREMRPGTQVIYNKETGRSTTRVVDVELYTSWKDGYYIFEEMPLEEIMTTFARWYNLRVAYQDEGVKKIAFSGSLKRYDDVVPLLKKLEYTRDVEFIITDNLVTIKKK